MANQVTVTVTCTGEAYDYDAALAVKLLNDQATSNPGASYALVGQIKTTLVSAAPPDSQGTVAIVVNADADESDRR